MDYPSIKTFPSPRTLHDALSVSAALTAAEARAATVDIKNEKNLAIISSDDPSATEKLQRINETTLNGKTYPVHIYIASPHNSCRGVIHNVIFGGGVYRCVPHRPKAQFCSTCFAIGHKSDVCRDSGKPRCRTCGKTAGDHVDDHDCKPGCPNCGKDHKADDPTCEVRQAADKAVREAAYLKRLQQREDDKQTNTVTIASRSPSPKRNSDNISTDRSRQHQSGNYSKSGSRVQSGDRSRPGGRNQSPDHSQTRGQQHEQPTIQQNVPANNTENQENVEQAPQQQPAFSYWSVFKGLLFRAAIIYFMTSWFRGQPANQNAGGGSGPQGATPASSNLYPNGTVMRVKNNGTIFLHVFFVLNGYSPDPKAGKDYSQIHTVYRKKRECEDVQALRPSEHK
ncbi:hypothetical protein HPB49_002389 [Dermacentor silvarum]|uniref:Uncharacterized protein n=1 Tax=Dermacentor silvarum TaxID=543639 RepID=A0ACB8C0N6_DERSI|nr:hypothetical protein HPB49_002389 [Dermacentor silvarum]